MPVPAVYAFPRERRQLASIFGRPAGTRSSSRACGLPLRLVRSTISGLPSRPWPVMPEVFVAADCVHADQSVGLSASPVTSSQSVPTR